MSLDTDTQPAEALSQQALEAWERQARERLEEPGGDARRQERQGGVTFDGGAELPREGRLRLAWARSRRRLLQARDRLRRVLAWLTWPIRSLLRTIDAIDLGLILLAYGVGKRYSLAEAAITVGGILVLMGVFTRRRRS